MNRQERDERHPWLRHLTDEQVWKLWLTYDRACNCKGCSPYYDNDPITTHDEAINLIGDMILTPDAFSALRMEELEDELQRDEEFRLASWVREFRHERESVEEERARYEREDELAEELAKRRRRRRPRN